MGLARCVSYVRMWVLQHPTHSIRHIFSCPLAELSDGEHV